MWNFSNATPSNLANLIQRKDKKRNSTPFKEDYIRVRVRVKDAESDLKTTIISQYQEIDDEV